MPKQSQILGILRIEQIALCVTAAYGTTKRIYFPRISPVESRVITVERQGFYTLRSSKVECVSPSTLQFVEAVGRVMRPLGVLLLALSFWLPFNPGEALADDHNLHISEYVHDVWQTADGLPQNTVQAIAQTPNGYLWIATQEGFVRFDGLSFQVFDRKTNPEISNNDIRALCVARDGSLWVGTLLGDLVRLKDGKFTSYATKHELGENAVSAIYEDRDANLWVGTRGEGLYQLKHGRFKVYKTPDGLANDSVSSIIEDRDGALWIGTDGGLSIIRGGAFMTLSVMRGLSHDIVRAVIQDRKGAVWIGTEGGGLHRYQDGKLTAYTLKDGLPSNSVHAVHEDREGNLWVGTSSGLSRLQHGRFENYAVRDGLSDNSVGSLFEDAERSLWIGTQNGGLNRLRKGSLTNHGTLEGLSVPAVWTVTQDASGNIWAGSDGGGLNRFSNGRFTVLTRKQGLSGNTIGALYPAKDGSLWVSTDAGLDRLKDGKITTYTTKQGLPARRESSGLSPSVLVKAIAQDQQNNLWFGTDGGGLCIFKDGRFTTYTTKEGLASSVVLWLTPRRDGGMWIGTTKGLSKLEGGLFTTFNTSNGLANNNIVTMYEDAEGVLWIGTEGGLSRLKHGKLTTYTSRDGLFDDLTFQILEDDRGNLWMSCNKGIYRVAKKELNSFADGLLRSVTSVSYGVSDGMKSKECAGGVQPAGWKSRDGKLWFPTIQGLVTIDPNDMPTSAHVPAAIVEKITAGRLSIDQATEVHFLPGERNLEFQFTAPTFIAPGRVQFRYQLQGFDKDWVDAGTRRIAYYTNIPPGIYHFTVTASNGDGLWNTKGASVGIYLAPYFYETFLFYGVCVFSFTIVVVALHRVRVSGLKEREKVLARRIHERTADLQQEIVERKRSEEMLQNSENKYRVLFEDSADANWLMDEKGFVACNSAALQMFGYPPGGLMLHPADISPPNQPDGTPSRAAAEQKMASAFLNGKERFEWLHQRKNGSVFPAEVCLTALTLSGQPKLLATVRDMTDRKVAEERIQFLAYYDALTGLPNRTLLKDRLSKALASARRQKYKVALLFLDLDRFKDINDSLGHSVGDLLLQEVAERLRRWGREQDTVARIGGDEFLIMLTHVNNISDAAVAAERLMDAMTAEFLVQGHSLNIGCSVGISIFPEHGTEVDDLIKNADAAMYDAKERRRNNFQFFTEGMNTQAVERLTLESSLRLALDKRELFLVYQPQMDMVTGKITGLEALLRWQHPQLGLVPPDKFIRIAENSGLIVRIGEWVLRTACAQSRKWQDEGLANVSVAVNVSAVQFRQEDFCELIRRVLQETGLAPEYLELELTESLLLSSADVTLSVLQKLKAMGLKLAIDDFGTGYSSFSYLRQFRVSKLKIDGSFVRDVAANPDDAAITAAIISMAKSLNLKVIAEGVENEAQMSFLRAHQCDEIQGYYFSKPLAVEQVADKLRSDNPDPHFRSQASAGQS